MSHLSIPQRIYATLQATAAQSKAEPRGNAVITRQELNPPASGGSASYRPTDESDLDREVYLRNRQATIAASEATSTYVDKATMEVFDKSWYRPNDDLIDKSPAEAQKILQSHNRDFCPTLSMRKLYLLVHGSNQRYAQWIGRAIDSAIRSGAITEDNDMRFLINEDPKKVRNLHVKFAMVLLNHGPNAAYNRKLVRQLSVYSGVPVPLPPRARAEQLFALKLRKLIDGLGTGTEARSCELIEQAKIDAYRVDFVIKVLDEGAVTDQFILEFDEAYHQTVRQRRKDLKRDAHLQALGWKIIRVKEGEADKWLQISRVLDFPLHEPTLREECIAEATCIHPRTKMPYISVDSIDLFFSFDRAVTADLIQDSKHRLSEFAKLLVAAGKRFTRTKMLIHKREHRVLRLFDE